MQTQDSEYLEIEGDVSINDIICYDNWYDFFRIRIGDVS